MTPWESRVEITVPVEQYMNHEFTSNVAVEPGCCKRCGAAYADCRAPISHGVPSINNIKLPGQAEGFTAKYGRGLVSKLLTAREREIIDANPILGLDNF